MVPAGGPGGKRRKRKQIPEQERPFRLPGGHVIPFLAFYAANMMVYWAGWDLDWKLFAAVGIGLVILFVQLLVRRDLRRVMRFKNGWWILPWFAGMLIISWQGIYSSDDLPDGQQYNIGFGWAFLVIAVFSAIIYWLAIRSRLSPEDARAHIEHTPTDVPAALAEAEA
jgi:amino acid transporter